MHADEAAVFLCTRCGSYGCGQCQFSAVAGREVCRACAQHGLGHPIPWEQRKELGNISAFWRTSMLVIRRPTKFFRTPTLHKGTLGAVMHGVLTYSLGQAAGMLFTGVLMLLGAAASATLLPGREGETLASLLGVYGCVFAGFSPIVALLFGPANAILGLVLSGAISHVILSAAGKAKGSFEDTLRAISYTNAPRLFLWIPLGGVAAWFWMLWLEVVAVRETHKCGTDWAVAAALGYRLLFFGAILLFYVVVIAGSIMVGASQAAPPPGV